MDNTAILLEIHNEHMGRDGDPVRDLDSRAPMGRGDIDGKSPQGYGGILIVGGGFLCLPAESGESMKARRPANTKRERRVDENQEAVLALGPQREDPLPERRGGPTPKANNQKNEVEEPDGGPVMAVVLILCAVLGFGFAAGFALGAWLALAT